MGEHGGSTEDHQDFGDMFSHNKKLARKPSLLLSLLGTLVRLIVIALLVLGGLGIYKLITHKQSPNNTQDTSLSIHDQLKNFSTAFPLYYPNNPPASLSPDTSSVLNQGSVVSFHYKYNGQAVIVTEQAKPIVIEQVQKTKTFDSNLGAAYLADLNGHTTGFIEAKKTLIIVSSAQNLSSDLLQQFITAFKQV